MPNIYLTIRWNGKRYLPCRGRQKIDDVVILIRYIRTAYVSAIKHIDTARRITMKRNTNCIVKLSAANSWIRTSLIHTTVGFFPIHLSFYSVYNVLHKFSIISALPQKTKSSFTNSRINKYDSLIEQIIFRCKIKLIVIINWQIIQLFNTYTYFAQWVWYLFDRKLYFRIFFIFKHNSIFSF
jgi:hypothetical protein